MVIIDEYSDLVLAAPKEMNTFIERIARLGRASFAVVDSRESRVILSRTGAQKLLGSGDMLLLPQNEAEAIHAQAAYVSFAEVQDVVKTIIKYNAARNI